jgi:hypothetical protein
VTALDLLTVLCGLLALAAAGALAATSARMLRAARDLESARDRFLAEAVPAVEELRDAAARASAEVERVDELIDLAGSIGDRLDSATEATYRALTTPVIKGQALASGTRRAAGRLRGSRGR